MPHPAPLRLLLPTRTAAPHPRLARGGNGCRVITTSAMLAEIGEASAPITALQAITRAASGQAHKARGTYAHMTDESVAAFLAAEARL